MRVVHTASCELASGVSWDDIRRTFLGLHARRLCGQAYVCHVYQSCCRAVFSDGNVSVSGNVSKLSHHQRESKIIYKPVHSW
jgi:hypothetical protein